MAVEFFKNSSQNSVDKSIWLDLLLHLFFTNNVGLFLVFKAKKSKEDLNVACRNFGLFDRHLNLGGPYADTNLPMPGFLVTVKAFYDNNFLSHFGEESELRYACIHF